MKVIFSLWLLQLVRTYGWQMRFWFCFCRLASHAFMIKRKGIWVERA
jgi:hypothetical protein